MTSEKNRAKEVAQSTTIATSVEAKHHDQLLQSHLGLQKLATTIALPATAVVFIVSLIADPCWHNAVILGGFVLMAACWLIALKLTKNGHLNSSVVLFTLSIIGLEFITMLVLDGNDASAILACTIMIIYASLFSRLFLMLTTVGTLLAFFVANITHITAPFEEKGFEPLDLLIFNGGFVALLLALAAIVLHRSHKMKDSLVEQMSTMNDEQNEIIYTANNVSSMLEDVVNQLEEFSVSFASQAAEQASAIAETNVVMIQIRQIAGDTAASATGTQTVAEATKKKSEQTSQQLKMVETGFGKVVNTNEIARDEFSDLARQAESIEEVLRVNKDIAAQIKILAVNAGIQAAKAGEYGVGFNVVARELKSMIQNTDKSLEDSRTLLEDIRKRARHSSETIKTSSELLRKHSKELNTTGKDIEDITASFVETAQQFSHISSSAMEQQTRLNEVSNGMNQIDISAGELNKQTSVLVDSVRRIADSQNSLKQILSKRKA